MKRMQTGRPQARHRAAGFTLLELVVVMTLIGLLLSLAVPSYMESLDRGREQVLLHNQAQLRKAIDQYFADRGTYPDRLDDLVDQRYLRSVPTNPFSGQADWVTVPPPAGTKGFIYDVTPSESRSPRSATVAHAQADEAAPPAPAASAAP